MNYSITRLLGTLLLLGSPYLHTKIVVFPEIHHFASQEFNLSIPPKHSPLTLGTVLSREGQFYLNYITAFISFYGAALFLKLFDIHVPRKQISKATQIWSAYYMGSELAADFYSTRTITLWNLIYLTLLTAQYWYHHKHIITGTIIPEAEYYSYELQKSLGLR